MAKNYEQIYEAVYTKGNKMDFGNSIIRGNGVPLDITSVYDSFDSAVVYAATNPVAYEGQVVAVTENNETIVYVISPVSQEKKMIDEVEYDVYLARVGSVTLGDGDTIILNEETGVLSLKGFADAETNTKLIKNADGNLAWVADKATEIQGDISALEERVGKTESDIATNASNITTNANAIDALEAKFESMGGIFNFAGTCTSDELANLDKTKYQPGDVILVDGSKEYLAVEDGETIKWEPFGDAQGVSALAGKVTTLEGQINGTGEGEDHVKGLTEKLADEVAARGVTDGKVATLEGDNVTNKTDIANLKVADATLQSNIDAKVAQVDYDKKVEEIAGKFETIESNFAEELGKKVDNTKFEEEVGKLESAIDGKADKATYEAKVAELAEDIAENAKAISDHAGEYTTLSGKVTANEQAIVLKADKSVVDGHTTTIGEHSTAIAKNTGDIATEKGRVDSLIETVTNNKKATDKTQEDLTALTTTVNNNKTATDKTQEDLDVVEAKVEALEKVGAQANVIEKVKVNGVDLAITDKAVDVTVPTGALANKDKVEETDLVEALATKINGKLDASAVTGDLLTHNASEFATAAQGAKADTAVQKITVMGTELTNGGEFSTHEAKTALGLGTAAYTDATAYATAEQGAKADTALQAADIANKADKADTLAGYGIGDAYTKTEVDGFVQAVKDYADANDASATYAISYDSEAQEIILTGANGGETTKISAKEFIKDGMLESAVYDKDTKKIVLTWNTDAGKESMDIELNDLVDTYVGEGAINVSTDGKITVVEKGVTKDMLDETVQASLAKADTALQAHQDISNLATKTEVQDVADDLSEYVTAHANDYTNEQVDTKVSTAVSGLNIDDYRARPYVVNNVRFVENEIDVPH